MFDQVKMDKLNPVNFLKIQEKENPDFIQKKTGSDFYTMIMEKTSENEKMISIKQNNEQFAESNENTKMFDHNLTERYSASNVTNNTENAMQETDRGKTSAGKDIVQKESSEKKKTETDSESSTGFINLLYNENNLKKISEIIRSVLSGDNKDANDKFQDLFRELKSKSFQNSSLKNYSVKHDTEKTQKSFTDQLKTFSREFKESVFADLLKLTGIRKSVKKFSSISEKDLKEIAVTILDNMKRAKSKETVKHDIKTGTDEIKQDKKQVLISEYAMKKLPIHDDLLSDKNNTGDRNSSRDTFNNSGSKSDILNKIRFDKTLTGTRNMDFRENLQDIIDKAKISVRDSRNGTFTVRLNPRELGNVNVNLIMENGVITGKFFVDSDDVKIQLQNNLSDLKLQLEESGISVGEFSVNVNDQRGKYLRQNDENTQISMSFINSEKDLITAADQYSLNTVMHNGYINMVV